MHAILRDIRYGFRSLRKSPGLTLVATAALTLGIAVTATIFSIVYGVLLIGLPYPDGDRIVRIQRSNPARGDTRMDVPIADYADYRAQQTTLVPIAAYYTGTVNVSGTGEAERFSGAWVTASTFDVASARALRGRVIQPDDNKPLGQQVAVIGYSMWQQRFGGDTGILGKVIRANGVPVVIVGVMPERFLFPDGVDLWLPLQMDPLAQKRGNGQWLTVVGKRKPGVSVAATTADFDRIARRLQQDYRETNADIEAAALPYVDAALGPEPHQLLYTMLGAVLFVLLIACANVANLLLDRAAHKSREVGIRTALGASRTAVIRQFLTEALLLSVAGAVLGTALAQGGIVMFNRVLADTQPPYFIDIRLHPAVLGFVVAMTALATLLSGALPAFQSSRTDINEILKDEARGSSSLKLGRMSRGLVVFEIALSCSLLVASGLMIKSVAKLRTMDPGFHMQSIFTARLGFPAAYSDTLMQRQFFTNLREGLAALPGARSATIMSGLPGLGSDNGNFGVEGAVYVTDREVPRARVSAVSAGFFETFGIPVSAGRGITSIDGPAAAQVAVVNQAFADKFFPGKDPLGRRIRQGDQKSTQPWMTIVGVVPTTFTGDPDHPRDPGFYVPLPQHHSNFVSIAVATTGPPMAITTAVRHAVGLLNPDIPLYRVWPMDEAVGRQLWYIRVFGTMFAVFGVIALFLASVGLYAVMSFSVSRRTREVGIRMALGARGGDVVRMIFRQGAWQLTGGMTIGLALAAGVAQLLSVILYDVRPHDPMIFAGVAAVLTAAGLAACFLPARRATRIDPLSALRSE